MTTHTTRMLIIGSGPAGLSAAIYGARAGMEPIVVQGLQPGGQLTITTDVENYPGFRDVIQGPWLMQEMQAQAEHVGTRMMWDTITSVDIAGGSPFKAVGDSGDEYVGDVLVIEAGPEALGAVMAALHLKSTAARGKSKKGAFLAGEDISMAEAVVPPRSRIIGQARAGLRLRRRFAVNLLAVSRQGRPLRGRLGSLRFRAGDVLLLEGEAEGLPEAIAALGCLPLAERGLQRGVQRLAGLSILVFAAAVAAATAGLISLPVALVAAAAAMVVLGMVPAREIYDSVDWPVVVLLGAMIPVGQALDATGTTGLVAGSLVALAAAASPLVVLVIVMVVTMTLSDLMNNAATAVVMAPVAVQVAQQLGVSPDPFLMAVAVGASCAFLTPIGHQNNPLILGPGGYEFGDYWRMGLPLEVLIVIVAVPMVLWVWPL